MPLNLRDVAAYGAYSKVPSTNLRDINAYAAVLASKLVHVRSVYGYALAKLQVTPNFGQAASTSLLASLNAQYSATFTASQVYFDNPQALSNDDLGYNSSVRVNANRSSGYGGTRTLRYNRWAISQAFANKDATSLPTSGMGSTIYASLAALNSKFGLVLTTDDVVDADITTGPTFNLVGKSTSLYFLPGSSITLGKPDPDLSTAMTTDQVDW